MIEKVIKLQSELKAPKNQYNSFGKYNYRSLEDIQEAVKPLLYKYGLFLSMSDEIRDVAGEIYVEATAVLTDGEQSVAAKAQAGVDVYKKGMDKSQAYGAASSYARKYALGALFLIDDNKDADATNTHGQTTTTNKAELTENSEAYLKVVTALKNGKATIDDVKKKYTLTASTESKLKSVQ